MSLDQSATGLEHTCGNEKHKLRSITLPMPDEWHHLHTETWVSFGSTSTNYTALNTKQNGISRGKHFGD